MPRFAKVAGACALAFAVSSVGATPWVLDDVEVCPAQASVLDPEIDSKSRLMAFMDGRGRLRVTSLLDDGKVGSAGCAGTLVDEQGTWGWPGNASGYNGPEWARSQRGLEIFYSRLMPDGVTPTLARAFGTGAGWQVEALESGDGRTNIVASTDEFDAQARLMYLRGTPTTFQVPMWRESTDARSEQTYAAVFGRDTGSAPRWVAGQRAMALGVPDAAGVVQAARFLIDERRYEVITSDAGNKGEVWMWNAPEYGGDLVMSTIVDNCCLRIYRRGADGGWSLTITITAESIAAPLASMYSPEPRVIRGKSYLALQIGNALFDPAAQIWVVGIEPTRRFQRLVSATSPGEARTEPEWFVSARGAYVFYSLTDPNGGKSLRRASAGLRP